jgi:SWI/SNF-related matrix-associated actin-dependent regulator 1 of chromatin subfamily A
MVLEGWASVLKKLRPKTVVVDECHYIKNSKALRTRAVIQLCRIAEHVICLSGTPIINRPIEMFNAIQAIEPGIFPSFWEYAQRYCGATHNGFGWDFGGAENTDELHMKLTRTIMLRRLKKDVLQDLPEKVRSVIPLSLSNRSEYNRASADFLGWLESQEGGKDKMASAERAETLVRLEKLKQLCVQGKYKGCVEWIENYLEQEEKLVVFCTHKAVVQKLASHFKARGVVLDGETAPSQRQVVVDRFQNDPSIKLFIGNIKAAGIGITLTAASATCFLELGWTPGEHDQAEDRVHRIGQKSDSVNAY